MELYDSKGDRVLTTQQILEELELSAIPSNFKRISAIAVNNGIKPPLVHSNLFTREQADFIEKRIGQRGNKSGRPRTKVPR
jgi:hypothetical protein